LILFQFFNLLLVSFGTIWKYLTLTGTIWAQSYPHFTIIKFCMFFSIIKSNLLFKKQKLSMVLQQRCAKKDSQKKCGFVIHDI
jgi:hypothetical protein